MTLIRSIALAGLSFTAAACANTMHQTPTELTDARLTYGRVSSSEASRLVPAQVHVAHRALQDAEKAFTEAPDSQNARDMAYIAQRQCQVAEMNGQAEMARRKTEAAQQTMMQSEARAGSQKQAELREAKLRLAQAQMEAKSIMTQLSGLKSHNVRQDDRGVIITLSGNVLFETGKSELLTSARKQLDQVAGALMESKSQKVDIEGYCDSTGSESTNENLSRARAEAVMNYFISKGMPADRMQAIGKGRSNPLATNENSEGRATNRRVELIVQAQSKAASAD